MQTKHNHLVDQGRLTEKGTTYSLVEKPVKECGKPFDDSGSDSDSRVQKNASSTGNLGKKVKGREGDGLLETSEVLSDAENDPSLPTEVTTIANYNLLCLNFIDLCLVANHYFVTIL